MEPTTDPLAALRLDGDLGPAYDCIDQQTDLDGGERRTLRARVQPMIVLPRTDAEDVCHGIYDVFSASGSQYVVDATEGRCTCPDDSHNQPAGGCKHVRRVRLATDATPLPARDESATGYWDWVAETVGRLQDRYPGLTADGPLATMCDDALEAVRTLDNRPPAPTPA